VWASLLLPLLSFVISVLISERYGWLTSLSATFLLLSSTVTSGIVLFTQWNSGDVLIRIHWFNKFSANMLVSNQSMLMLFVVAAVSFLVHLYSAGYMAGDRDLKRYFAMLGFFTFTMQGIVLADSLLILFLFWELVGFSSYMLIGHYIERSEAARASKKAFIMNRIGDAGFLIGLMIVWPNAGTFDLSEILANGISGSWQTTASLCIFCGVIGKSAQFPLFTWLPDAMEGPTPVSALIHAATMVAAGVYLLSRTFPLFTTDSLPVVAVVGAITSVIGALAALTQFDIKKILAYSTISQLGLMVMAIGMGVVNEALLHLFTHAFFKACLFLCAGAVIHALHQAQQQSHVHFDVQDIRNMGGLFRKMPVTVVAFVISGASLAGIPFFSGFLSKEAILTAVLATNNFLSWTVLITMGVVSITTVVYTFRLIWFVFFGNEGRCIQLSVTEVPVVMRIPIVLLAVCSLWFIVSWHPFEFTGWIVNSPRPASSLLVTVISSTGVALALIGSWVFFRKSNPRSSTLLRNAFFVDHAYLITFKKILLPVANLSARTDSKVIDGIIHLGVYANVTLAHFVGWIDRSIVDGLVHFTAGLASWIGSAARGFQSGKIQLYVFWATFAIIIFLICALN
jgi:NADH-quinone oxidoreductase subunit L